MKITSRQTGVLGVNTYLAWDEESKKGFIVDPGGYDKYFTDVINEENISLEYIILTHGHGDHIGGIPELRKLFPQTKLLACKHEIDFLADPDFNMSGECAGGRMAFTPDVAVEEGETLDVGGIRLKFIHTPGHTPGGMCILAGDVLFSGDTLFQLSIGRTDFPGGSFPAIKESIQKKLFRLPDDTVVLPGHMGQTTIGTEKTKNPFVCIR